MKRSNIILHSNIHLVAGEKPYDDPRFLSKVVELNTLRKLRELIARYCITGFQLVPHQNRILEQCLYCSKHPNKSVTSGVVRSNGALFQVLRCEIIETCRDAIRGRCKEHTPVKVDPSIRKG